ncbi:MULTISPECIES: tripartite tricarboxylate transporter substrate binding protein [unclassified Chelatococcus]|uniref:Bug family tripartite tricarboxylate transporter substrate binding protein n=1 Tax=unclassified Chelatococcus TaxID=2638111 RepID=UPI001BCE02AD|nr:MULTISPECIES: tripartite tricarboxylate transporter substrate binding protein [unclassified Chelatococcus]CAH1654603.1 LacI family transcriptional regulator [Hyphomicrobiales bacterium]MBS7740271.1 tripartite tricarboxylate transporter substrate binding protein [Chelatococcus sp. HY11]MBX3544899.1 tripartite tricarboxylate transporter substrate binding protein [Chelatococcus sp.]MCO5078488.1 tripartite tricarboxylate transporter substrate binding protein [Chelatococcus sp.]CAH1685370.1 LacI
MSVTRRALMLGSVAAFALPSSRGLAEQDYPNRTIRIVVPSSAGGPNDIPARLASQFLPTRFGQSVLVENRAGAGGALGTREVAKAAPDGYTLLSGGAGMMAVIPALSASAGYDPIRDFAPIAKFMEAFQILLVNPASPWQTVAELVAHAKDHPGTVNYAHAGIASIPHLAGEMFRLRTGAGIIGVPFRGGSEALVSVLNNICQLTFENVTIALPMVREGKLRALAVTSAIRSPLAPELPTMIEAGVPDYEVTTFFGLEAPAGTSPAIVAKLNRTINEALATPELREAITKLGGLSELGTPEDFGRTIAAHFARWQELGKATGIRLD